MELSRPSLVVAFELSEKRKAIVADALAGASDVVYLTELDEAARAEALRKAGVLLTRFLFLQLQSANLRNVRAGGDRRQPRILQSEPELPRARIRSAQGQAETILLLIHASSAFAKLAIANLPKDILVSVDPGEPWPENVASLGSAVIKRQALVKE